MLKGNPDRDAVHYHGNDDQTPVHAEIRTEELPPGPKEQRAKSHQHREHDQVGSNWPQLSPPAGPGMNDKPIEQPRRKRDDAKDSEGISNTIHHRITESVGACGTPDI